MFAEGRVMAMNTIEKVKAELLTRLSSRNPDEIRSVAFEIAELGIPESIQLLVRHLQHEDLGVQEAAEFALRKIRGAETVRSIACLLRLEDVSIRNSAMDILREIGSDDLKTLYTFLHDEDVDIRIFIADILGSTGSSVATPMLIEVLEKDPDVNVRYQACISLGKLGNNESKEALLKAIEKDEEWVQFAAVEALAKLKVDDCIDRLMKALSCSSELVACTIIHTLGSIGNISCVPVLLQRLDNYSGPLCNAAVKAIVQIIGAPSLSLLGEKDLEKLHEYLLIALEDEDEDVVLAALTGLSFVGSIKATKAVFKRIHKIDPIRDADLLYAAVQSLISIGYNEALKEALFSGDEETVKIALEVCGTIGCRRCVGLLISSFWTLPLDMQQSAIHYLVNIADTTDVSFFMELLEKHKDTFVLKEALLFLGETASCITVAQDLLKFLHDPDDEVKETALEACLALENEDVNEKIVALFLSEDPLLRKMSTYAMGKIDTERYLDTLLSALKDTDAEVRKVALEALGRFCEKKPELFSTLSMCMSDESKDVRLALVELARNLGTEEALELIIKMIEDKDSWVCIRAIESLADSGSDAALYAMIERLDNADVLVTMKIVEVLGIIGGKVAFQALLGLTDHEDPDVQSAVSKALSYIQEEQGEDI